MRHDLVMPRALQPGDTIRFVSPAASPERLLVERSAALLRSWGHVVDFGQHAFGRLHYLAGSDDQRLVDLSDAPRDADIRAIFATRGGKGTYRIADRLDFAAARQDPKPLVGFTDISILHLALGRAGVGGGIHGGLNRLDLPPKPGKAGDGPLRHLLGSADDVVLQPGQGQATHIFTTSGVARRRLFGANLDMLATAAGWALPKLDGCILFLEAVNMYLGQIDRQLTMLHKGGHLAGIAGVAIGQFIGCEPSGTFTVLDLLAEHLARFDVPVLGGLLVGHGPNARPVPLGYPSVLDADQHQLTVRRG